MKEGQKGKSVYNKLVVLSQLLKQHGRPRVLKAADWPSFVETVRPIYEDSELANLFNTCTHAEETRFKFYLMSGFRDAEGRFVTWRDVDFKHWAVRVTAKSHWGFHPKNWEEREVPVPQRLIALLQSFRPANSGPDDPVFPSDIGAARRRHAGEAQIRSLGRQAELRALRRLAQAGRRHGADQ
jgi:integrase/recombinase XerD